MRPAVYFLILLSCILPGCVKEDYFGKSALKQIVYFSLKDQAGNSRIIEDSLIIRVPVAAQADLTQLYPDSIKLSSYASVSPGTRVPQDFSNPVLYRVQAENGSTAVYTIVVTRASETAQLENSGFDDWYTPSGVRYQEPGTDPSTIWATGNAGVVTIGQANVTPLEVAPGDNQASLVTADLGSLGQIAGQRMAAGSIFTGIFKLDISNPLNSTKFGVPFTGRPVSFTVSYRYAPGTPYRNGRGTILDKQDSCDIYLILENRESSTIKRMATGWFRSGENLAALKDITIPLQYGELPAGLPAYMHPVNGVYGTTGESITHISFVAASSAYGALFEGGVNSTLILANLTLNY